MKKYLALFVVLILAGSAHVAGKNLKAYFTYCTFNAPGSGPFVETYLTVVGNTVEYAHTEDGFQGSIQVTLVFKQGEEIKNFKKYNLLSPMLADTSNGFINFIDQQRIALPNGQYEFEIVIADLNSKNEPFEFHQELAIEYAEDKMSISDIELIESFSQAKENSILTKSGLDLVPYVSDYYPSNMNKISFYAEIYNTDKELGAEERYLANYYIELYEKGEALGKYRSFARQTAKPVNVVFNEFNISDLPSGNYNLVVEVRNRQNELMSTRKLFFQRSNPNVQITSNDLAALSTANSFVEAISDRDTLVENIRSLWPIASEVERSFAKAQVDAAELDILQKFFLNFWMSRNSLNPELEWVKYQRELIKVDNAFATSIKKGYETDRGRVYLQYGPPNTRNERANEPSSYPYEIWHYYKIGNFSNRKFVFYNPDLVTNDYELLHSDMFGEQNDYRWQAKLNKRNTTFENIDTDKGDDHWGGRSDEFFTLPR